MHSLVIGTGVKFLSVNIYTCTSNLSDSFLCSSCFSIYTIRNTRSLHRILYRPSSVISHDPYYLVGSKSFRPDIQKPRQMENAVRDI